MTRILVSGYYGFNNAGDEAILGGIIKSFSELESGCKLIALSGDPEATRALHGIEALPRTDLGSVFRALSRADLLLSGGGSLLQDVTSRLTIPYYLSIVAMAKMRRRPAMFYGQGIGPVTTGWGRFLMRLLANRADLIAVRDEESSLTLARLGVTRPPVVVTADAALALGEGSPPEGEKLLRSAGISTSRPMVGVSVRPWKHSDGLNPALAAALDEINRSYGTETVFFPMHWPQDVSASRAVMALMKTPASILEGQYDYRQLLSLVSRLDVLVGLRYHALVFAAMNGVPLVGLTYDPKNDSFLRLVGRPAAGSTHNVQASDIAREVAQVLENRQVQSLALRGRVAVLRQKALRNAELALELARGRRRGAVGESK